MGYKIKEWKQFQHFKDRTPPWIKLYRYLLDDPDWHELSGDSAKKLVMLWLIASEDPKKSGNLPNIRKIAFRLRITEKQTSDLLKKLGHWVLLEQDDINPISRRYQDDAPETETETETETEKKKIFKPPSLEDVILYCQEKGFDAVLANRAFEHYNIADWHDAHGKKVKNWKQKINTNWLKPENKPKPNKNSSDAFAV